MKDLDAKDVFGKCHCCGAKTRVYEDKCGFTCPTCKNRNKKCPICNEGHIIKTGEGKGMCRDCYIGGDGLSIHMFSTLRQSRVVEPPAGFCITAREYKHMTKKLVDKGVCEPYEWRNQINSRMMQGCIKKGKE